MSFFKKFGSKLASTSMFKKGAGVGNSIFRKGGGLDQVTSGVRNFSNVANKVAGNKDVENLIRGVGFGKQYDLAKGGLSKVNALANAGDVATRARDSLQTANVGNILEKVKAIKSDADAVRPQFH